MLKQNFKSLFAGMRTNQKGFSLIELMVVVAILGILATIAVPQVSKFMAKARQAEVKSLLAALYTAEKAFYTEYNTYYGDFMVIGFSPEGKIRYNVGFSELGTAPAGIVAPAGATTFVTSGFCGVAPTMTNGCSLMSEGTAAGMAVTAAKPEAAQFLGKGLSKLISSGAAIDTWSIDQNKNLVQIVNGIP